MELIAKNVASRPIAFSIAMRFLWCALFWLILSEGIWREWPVALVTIVMATWASFMVWPRDSWNWRLLPFIKFIPYFLWQSFLGGIDVARRAFSPAMPLHPGFVEVSVRLKSDAAKVFFLWVVCLLPGTASVQLRGNKLRLHALDTGLPIQERLTELETTS
ncbi:MAG: Na+/H+ antiporter subunit E [Verrucomicrobia bacterium]|nr:Na+/H+ antiporter subunit E [Verrucomicrobiota bacterium]